MTPRHRPAHILIAFLLLAACATGADATWRRVETDKFVVYGNDGEQTLRDFATKLTTFDAVLRSFHPSTLKQTPATKVQVFVLSERQLKRVHPEASWTTAGFYQASNEGIFAVALRRNGLGADDVLFHEYAHFFMYENFPAAYPAWFVEGWAEYFMTVEIDDDTVEVGNYNPARLQIPKSAVQVSMDTLLTAHVDGMGPNEVSVFYSRAWLLMHYMRSDPRRAEQLDEAIRAISKGADPVKAFETATGKTVDQLSDDLAGYKSLPVMRIATPLAAPPAMTVTVLPDSTGDLLLDDLRLRLHLKTPDDDEFLANVRRDAAAHPGDRLAETTLARAEFQLGDVAAGEAIMTRRLAANGDDVEDLLLAGTGQLAAGIRDPSQRQARFRAARPFIAKAYAREKRDYRVLHAYALSRSVEPGYPNDNDLNALLEARNLAPAVRENALNAGLALIKKGRRDEAAKMLGPVMNDPHGGEIAAKARAALNGEPPPAE